MIKIKSIHRIILLLIILFTYQVSNAETGNLKKISALHQKTEELMTEGKYDQALKIATKTLSLQKTEFGAKHYSVAESLGAMATIYYNLGEYGKADFLYKEVMPIYENELGAEHIEVGISLNNLGQLYLGSGNYMKAEELFSKALLIYENIQGPEDPDIATILNNLGAIDLRFSNFDEAKRLFEKALVIMKKHYGSEHPKVAYCLNNLGNLYYHLNEYSKSESFFKKALEIRENYYGADHNDVLISLNNLAMLYLNLDEYTEAEPLFNKALLISEKILGSEHPTVAMIIGNLATLNSHLGKYKTAISLNKKALAIQKKIYGSDHDSVAISLNNLAMLHLNLGEYIEAEPLFNKALIICEKALGSEHPTVAMILNNLGMTYLNLGEYTKTALLFKRALNIYEKAYDSENVQIATTLNNLALLYQDLDEFEMAEQMYKKALTIYKKVLGSDSIQVAGNLNNLAFFYKKLGNYDKAKELYKEALVIYKNALENDHPLLTTTQDNLAVLYYDMGEYSDAKQLLQQVLITREKFLGTDHIEVADSLNNLGGIYTEEGDQIKAEEFFNRALNIYTESIGPENKQVARTQNNLANVYEKLGKYKQAQDYYEKSLALYEKIFGLEHSEVSDMMVTLALSYAAQGDRIKARQLIIQSQKININLIDHVMGFSSDKRKFNFLVSKERSLHVTLSFLFQPHLNQDLSVQKDILNVWLKRKGLILETQKQYHDALCYSDDKQISQAAMELSKVRSRLSKLIFSTPNQEDSDTYRNEIAQLENQKGDLEATLSKLSKVFATERKKSNVTCVKIAQTMPSNTILVDFARISQYNFENKNNDQTWLSDRYIAFIIHAGNGDNIDWIDLGPADEIDNEISAFREMLAGVNTDMSENTTNILKKLHSLVFQPIKSKIGDTKEIFISPDGDLSLLPFEVLQGNDDKFLIENYTFNYLSAGRDILGFGETIEGNNRSLIMGNPDFNINSEQKRTIINNLELKKHDRKSIAKRSKDIQNSGSWQSLPGTLDEVQAIYNIIGKDKAELFTGKEAIEDVLMDWGVPKVLHLATHGFFLENKPIDFKNTNKINRGFSLEPESNQLFSPSPISVDTENPLLRSGIVLAGANKILNTDNDTISDGIVTSEEILGMNLRGTEMVVLSACDTGLGEVKNGEGVFGLRRAFTQAGTKSLVMSMWKVPDKETKELMVNFYSNIYTKGMDRCQALRQATLKQIQITKHRYGNANPYYWGAFVFMGEPSGTTLNNASDLKRFYLLIKKRILNFYSSLFL